MNMAAAAANQPSAVQSRLVAFVRLARANDFRVGVAEEIDAQRIAMTCGLDDMYRLRWGLRSLLCNDHNDWQRFDALFEAFWVPADRRQTVRIQAAGALASRRMNRTEQGAEDGSRRSSSYGDNTNHGEGGDAGEGGVREGASMAEQLAGVDFRQLAGQGRMHEMERLAERLARRMRRRLTRRQHLQRHGRRIHLRRTLRASLAMGGTPLELVFRQRRKRQPRLIIFIDVSRSMSLYSYVFLRFAHGIVKVFRDASAFAVHTALVPISAALRQPDRTRMQASLALISQGWSGGTRIGECLAQVNRDHGALITSRSVVLIVSDGLDTGEPGMLAQQLESFKRRCRKIVWLNPLLGRAGYEPRTGAMLAALPFIDVFAPAHNLRSLMALEPVLTGL